VSGGSPLEIQSAWCPLLLNDILCHSLLRKIGFLP